MEIDSASIRAENAQLRAEIACLKQRIEQLDVIAHHDPLTGKPNRRGCERELERLVARLARHGGDAALLYVDIDGLKIINDSFGHRAGDQALIQVAALLSTGLRRTDLVARVGGDEFVVVLERSGEREAQETARRLSDIICASEFLHDGDALPLSVAIGVGMVKPDDTIVEMLDRADADMYRSKAA